MHPFRAIILLTAYVYKMENTWSLNLANMDDPAFCKIHSSSEAGQEKLGARSCRAPIVHLKQYRGERNIVYLKYLYLHKYIFIINLDLPQ